jgi:hypothetical protein
MAKPITNLAVGSKIKFGTYKVEGSTKLPIIWQVADKNHPGYPVNSVTLITEKIIDLRGFDAKEPTNDNADRQGYGNNRYLHSNLRQWLNKTGHPWFIKQHTADETPNDTGMSQPTGYDDELGFLSNFTADELSILLDTTLTVAKNTVTDGGGSETVTDKIFLASNTEVGLTNENSIVEGSLLPLFSNDASRIAYVTQQCFDNTKSSSKPSAIGNAWYYWLRTPNASFSQLVRSVNTSGSLNNHFAYVGNFGVRPLCNLKSGILVSDTVDADGCYTILVYAVPHIITLDKAITITAGEKLEKIRFNPKQVNAAMSLKTTDTEKLVYKIEGLNTNTADVKIEGKDGEIDKIAYTVS